MADQKISELTALTGANVADDDAIAIVDTSATETKKIVFSELKTALDSATGFVRITGDTMTGDLDMSGADVTLGDNDKLILGAGSDLQIYHDGANSYIQDVGTGALGLFGSTFVGLYETGSGDKMVIANGGSDVELYYANALKLATTSTGVDITGIADASTLFRFGVDNSEIANNYLRFKPSGAAYIDHSTVGQDINFRVSGTTALDTTAMTVSSTGVDITGALTSDGLTASASTADYIASITNSNASNSGGGLKVQTYWNTGSNSVLKLLSNAGANEIANFAGNGDISFYEDTGTTAKFFWDASAESLGIGTSSPSYPMTIHSTGDGIKFEVSDTVDANYRIQVSGNDIITGPSTASDYIFQTGNTERMRISSDGSCRWTPDGSNPDMTLDANGNLLVGTTSLGNADVGVEARANGTLTTTADSQTALFVKRIGSGSNDDGELARFQNADGTVGSIGSQGGSLVIGTDDTGFKTHQGVDAIVPYNPSSNAARDNAIDLGYSTNRFKDLYLSNGIVGDSNSITISTDNGTTDHVTVDTSGNLLVGTDSYGSNVQGVGIGADAFFYVTRQRNTANTSQVAAFNRKGTDGSILRLDKDDSTVGSIGVSGNDFYVTGSATNIAGTYFANSKIMPMRSGATSDNTIDLGTSSKRFKNLYLSGGVVLDDNPTAVGGDVTSKTLDDYEEGTFTPTMEFGGSDTGVTYQFQDGVYTKVGRLVTCFIRIKLSSNGSLSGSAQIESLPFTVGNLLTTTAYQGGFHMVNVSNAAGAQEGFTAVPNEGTTGLVIGRIADSNGNSSYTATASQITNTFDFRLTVTYMVA